MNENIFRGIAALILFTCVGISNYFRRKADRDTGETLARQADGNALMLVIKLFGLVLWFSPLIYLLNPAWMTWSKAGLPDAARWAGVVIGIVCALSVYWLFSSIGTGITPVSATRKEHKLVTHGIYKYIRHPLYTFGSTLFVALGMMADNWFIALAGVLAFIVMAIRTPKEEANLIAKFGDEYREYMKRTGRFLPKLGQ
jgi:protein-S-isoprenylcysteine O-methyltransferase Ste14